MAKKKTTGQSVTTPSVVTPVDKSAEFNEQEKLISMLEANHSLNVGSKVTAAHTSTKQLLSTMGSSYQGNSRAFHQIIKECTDVYYSTPVVRNIIDLMADFACEGINIVHRVPAYQRLFNNWARKTGFYNTIRDIFHTTILAGNTIIIRQEGKINKKMKTALTKAKLSIPEIQKNTIPVGYTLLDPCRVEIDNSSLFGDRIIYYNFTDADIERLRNPKTENDILFTQSLPPSFVREAIESKKTLLDSNSTITLFYKKLQWQNWAFPLIFSALDDINFKKMLRQMDESSAADVIKAVVIFKLGKTEMGFAPDKERFRKLSSLLKDVSQAKNIVWDDLIEVIDSFPPIEKILGKEKYEVVDEDILSNFGVSKVLVSGSSGSFSNGFLSVRGLQEKLETVRTDVLNNFIIPELERLCIALDIPNMPSVNFSSMSLRDEVAEKKLLIDLMDRKIMSPETVLGVFEFDSEVESIRLGRKKQKFPDVISPLENTGDTAGGPGDGGGGRPLNTKTPQKVQRNTEPKGISLGDKFTQVFNVLAKTYAFVHELGKLEDSHIEEIKHAALIAVENVGDRINEGSVKDAIENATLFTYHTKYNSLSVAEICDKLHEE